MMGQGAPGMGGGGAMNDPEALKEMAQRLKEAQDRGLWQSRLNDTRQTLERLAGG